MIIRFTARHVSLGTAIGLIGALAITTAAVAPADARHYYVRHAARGGDASDGRYAAIVLDANSGQVLHAANPDELRHPASLTKIMTLYLLFERLDAGKLKLDSELDVSEHAASQHPTKLGLKPGHTIQVEDAIKGLVTRSANDAAVVIAEAIGGGERDFAELMTRKAHAIGMSRTVYRNASGLPDDDQVTTARDQALLGRVIQERFPRYYKYFSTASFTYHGTSIRNHNQLLGRVEGVDGIKTGYTEASGFNLVTSVHRNGRHLVSVVLGGSSAGARDARMRSLIEQYIGEASNRRTTTAIADGGDERDSRGGEPAARETRAAEPKPAPRPSAPAASYSVASVTRTVPVVPVPVAPGDAADAGMAPPAPRPAADTIRPIRVKTVKAQLAPTQIAALAADAEAADGPADPGPADRAVQTPAMPRRANARPPAAIVRAEEANVTDIEAREIPREPAAETLRPRNTPAQAPVVVRSGWMIQVGAFEGEREARQKLNDVQAKASQLAHADPFTEQFQKGDKTFYRARFAGLQKDGAEAACRQLKRNEMDCMVLKK